MESSALPPVAPDARTKSIDVVATDVGSNPTPSLDTRPDESVSMQHSGRRRFLVSLIAAPTLTLAARLGIGDAEAATTQAIPSLPGLPDLADLGDVLILAGALTSFDLRLEIGADGRARLELPRAEVGQGLTTSVAMIVAEELDARLQDVDVVLSRARPELLFNQLTGSSNSLRSLWHPLRAVAAAARARLVAAAARQWNLPFSQLSTRDSAVHAPDGRSASYASLAAAAADTGLSLVVAFPKPAERYRLIGTPTGRIDARDIVTGKAKYAMDLDVPGALPTVVARAPTVDGKLASYDGQAARNMPGVIAVVQVPNGVAVVAETFDQAFKARDALLTRWNRGPLGTLSDPELRTRLRGITAPLLPPLLIPHVDASFDFAFVSHAPMETLGAVADVRGDSAHIWYSGQSPILAQQAIALALGLPLDRVVVEVIRGGGSFGRRLFFDAAIEAALISKAIGRPIKLMWSRNDDMRHGRMRPATHHKLRATYLLGQVLTYQHHMAAVQTDLRHGAGEAITALGFAASPALASQAFYLLTQKLPYNFGVVTNLLNELPIEMPTASWRGVYSGMTGVAHERMVDLLASAMGQDPVRFRRGFLSSERARAVLDKVAEAGGWGRALPAGIAQGVAVWEEFGSAVAYLVEIDARDPLAPRVLKGVAAADVGRAINPRGLEAQLMGCLTDGLSITLQAGLHLDSGAIREGSYADFHYARMRHSPLLFEAHILPGNGEPGGAGELGLPAAAAAVANAYARATGIRPTRFPILD